MSKFSKKHQETIADILNRIWTDNDKADGISLKETVNELCFFFIQNNPNFDRNKFTKRVYKKEE